MNPRKIKKLAILCIFIVVIIIVIGGIITMKKNQIPNMTFSEMVEYTAKNNKNAIITVGIIKNGVSSYKIYGENGIVLPQYAHIYEIGSITKTFTVSLLYKAIAESKIKLDDSLDLYLELSEKEYYPTIRRLITHRSGYKSYNLDLQIIQKYFRGKNVFSGISEKKLINQIEKANPENKDYGFNYSNLGISAVGLVLSKIYGSEYTDLINNYIQEELHLKNTMVSNGSGDLEKYWDWEKNDAFIPAGALFSTIDDMMEYAQMQINGTPGYFLDMHETLAKIDATSSFFAKLNIRMDSIGAAWIIDSQNNITWHNGGTGNFNSYLGFDSEKQIAVVILSNLPPNYRIPATPMGVKLLKDLQNE